MRYEPQGAGQGEWGSRMGKAKGEDRRPRLRVDFDRRLKLEFHGSRVTSDGATCLAMPSCPGEKPWGGVSGFEIRMGLVHLGNVR